MVGSWCIEIDRLVLLGCFLELGCCVLTDWGWWWWCWGFSLELGFCGDKGEEICKNCVTGGKKKWVQVVVFDFLSLICK